MAGRRLIITDIHGCGKTFAQLVYEVLKIKQEDTLYLLGDYIDRGPDSKKVIDTIFELQEKGVEVYALRGNHEQMMLDSLDSPENFSLWMFNGGESTLKSFGVQYPQKINKKYLDFFQNTGFYIETSESFLVHAGFNFKLDDIFSDTESMLWIRGFRINPKKIKNKKLIHGHTPTNLIDIQKNIEQDETDIVLDNGCAFNRPLMNNLLCLNLDNMELIIQPNIED